MTVKRLSLPLALTLTALSINAYALPIDWTGTFGVDTHLLSNTRHTSDDIPVGSNTPTGPNAGTQGVVNGPNGANFQTYIFKLNPNIIVNDGVTLKGEFSSGYIRGGFAGGEGTNSGAGSNADGTRPNSYMFVTPAQRSALNVNQLYMEMYADAALIKAGRFSKHYGMGMVFDNGNDAWDRFFTMYDGVEAEMKIGNFALTPYWAKITSYDNNLNGRGNGSRPAGDWDTRELGLSAKYDNKNRDLVVSLLYAKRSSEQKSILYNTVPAGGAATQGNGKTSVTVIEPYVSKRWNKFQIEAEGSLQTGEYGVVPGSTATNNKLSGKAFIGRAKYELNPKWDVGVDAGQVSGNDPNSSKFGALYLHPNFHIAELMFRYNYAGFHQGNRSIFDSSITNARFYKFYGNYKSDKWTWKGALVMASALETNGSGAIGYQHQEGYNFAVTNGKKQSKNYGYEVDLGFDYRWNPNVTISGYYAYWAVGDYWAYNGGTAAKDLGVANVHGGGLRATLEF